MERTEGAVEVPVDVVEAEVEVVVEEEEEVVLELDGMEELVERLDVTD